MLSIPKSGWTDFILHEDHKYCLSYLTDVPTEWLRNAINGLEWLEPFSVHGFCEPGRMICTVSYLSCFIIFENDGITYDPRQRETWEIGITMHELCEMLYHDISCNIDEWVNWEMNSDDEEEDLLARKKEMEKQLEELSRLIEFRKNEFENPCQLSFF